MAFQNIPLVITQVYLKYGIILNKQAIQTSPLAFGRNSQEVLVLVKIPSKNHISTNIEDQQSMSPQINIDYKERGHMELENFGELI